MIGRQFGRCSRPAGPHQTGSPGRSGCLASTRQEPEVRSRLKAVRIGGQADVLVYTGEHSLMNPLAALYMRVVSWLSYLY